MPATGCHCRTIAIKPPHGRRPVHYEKQLPGKLVHVDIKKRGKIPTSAVGGYTAGSPGSLTPGSGPGLRVPASRRGRLHPARIPGAAGPTTPGGCSRVLGSSREVLHRARGPCDRCDDIQRLLLLASSTVAPVHTTADEERLQRFNCTLTSEWAYVRQFQSDTSRASMCDA